MNVSYGVCFLKYFFSFFFYSVGLNELLVCRNDLLSVRLNVRYIFNLSKILRMMELCMHGLCV